MAMLTHSNLEAVADAVKISRITVWRWLKNPIVVEKLRAARRDYMRRTTSKLQQLAHESVECLAELQRSGKNESVRVSAARALLELALKAVDTEDVQMRLDALEQTIKAHNAFTPGPRISVTYGKDGRENDRQNGKAPSAGSGTFGER